MVGPSDQVIPMAIDDTTTFDAPQPAQRWIAVWCSVSPRFADFVVAYGGKIRRKFKNALFKEDAYDVLAELETSFRLLANSSYDVEYEPYGAELGAGPDFCIKCVDREFNAETKRIREAAATVLYDGCKNRLISALRAIPSQLGVSVDCYSLDEGPEFAERIKANINSVIFECMEVFNSWKAEMKDGETRTFRPTALPEFEVKFTHVSGKSPDSPTANFSCVSPILYTQRESFKFTDLLLGCLRQMRVGLPNVLIIRLQSITHESRELPSAVNEIYRLVHEKNHDFFKRKGFEGIEDFKTQFSLLSAAVIIADSLSTTIDEPRNEVWENPASSIPASKNDILFFKKM
jgi:hypothetical protein